MVQTCAACGAENRIPFESRAKAGRALIAKLDTERLPEVAGRFGIRGIPTLIRFDGARETKRVSGALGAEQLAQAFAL
jgi:thioredoxin 2